jgi:hypothetical protein
MTCAKDATKIAGMNENASAPSNPNGSQNVPQDCVKRTDHSA